jgi:hypothetical protein
VVAAALSAAVIGSAGPTLAATQDVILVRQAADPQTNVGGGVTVKVSRLEAADAIAFKIVLDTHSVNLDTYDLSQLAVLRTPSGEQIAPLGWEAGPLLLVIRDVAGVAERTFSWAA